MPYPSSLQPSLARVAATRAARRQQQIPRLSLEAKAELIQGYHPDFRPGSRRPLRIGPNAGDPVPPELADLLEAYSRLDPDRFDLSEPDADVDVLAIGGGGAGTSAALLAHLNGARVLLATKLRHGDSNTIMAEGGIAAATHRHDSPTLHFLDTMGGGRFENDPQLVKVLVHDAPLVVEWLTELGVMFDRAEDGSHICSLAGGHSRRRVHSCKDYSGLEMMRVLRDELRTRQVPVLEFSPLVELLVDDQGQCAGAVLSQFDTGRYLVVRARATILATGGIGRLHVQGFPTTNHFGATADGLVVGYRAGARLLHMDAIQFHPTGAAWPPQMLGWLLTEALRGTGVHLVNRHGERFINEMETRDCTSSAILREVDGRGNGLETPAGTRGVWLDTPMIDLLHGPGTLVRLFAGIVHRFQAYGIDPRQEPLLVYPTQHYQNGGLRIDAWGRTAVPNLYVAGEASGGVQGRNRLGGNSLLDIFVFGRRAGQHAAEHARGVQLGRLGLEHVRRYHEQVHALGVPPEYTSPLLLPNYTRRHERQAPVGGVA
ncbi:MAG: FAD-binding protein [Chloroflexi bacterium]|nr:FAD-binding protein [Chloroflexota bacterium]